MSAFDPRFLLRIPRAHPVVCVVLVVLLTLFLMQCVWTIRHGGSLMIRDSLLRLEVPTSVVEERPPEPP